MTALAGIQAKVFPQEQQGLHAVAGLAFGAEAKRVKKGTNATGDRVRMRRALWLCALKSSSRRVRSPSCWRR